MSPDERIAALTAAVVDLAPRCGDASCDEIATWVGIGTIETYRACDAHHEGLVSPYIRIEHEHIMARAVEAMAVSP